MHQNADTLWLHSHDEVVYKASTNLGVLQCKAVVIVGVKLVVHQAFVVLPGVTLLYK